MQTRLMSMLETMTNIIIGFVVSFLSQIVIFKMYDIKLDWHQNIEIMLWFTAVSILRSYAIRRFFNNIKRRTT